MNKMKILVVGGVHGNEQTGIALARVFIADKDARINGLVVNREAVRKKVRFLETDLNRSFGVLCPMSFEERLARKQILRLKKFGLVLDVHNTKASGTTCAITVQEPNELQLRVATHLGFSKLVVMPPGGSLISVVPQRSLSVEIAEGDRVMYPEDELVDKIRTIEISGLDLPRVDVYMYVGKVMRKTLLRLGIKYSSLRNFAPLTSQQKKKLGLKQSVVVTPIFFKKYRMEEVALTLIERLPGKIVNNQ